MKNKIDLNWVMSTVIVIAFVVIFVFAYVDGNRTREQSSYDKGYTAALSDVLRALDERALRDSVNNDTSAVLNMVFYDTLTYKLTPMK